LEGRAGGRDTRRKSRVGSKVKPEDAIADASWWSVRRQDWTMERRRKPEVDRTVSSKIIRSDEELEVGSKAKLEDAAVGASRRLNSKAEPENAVAGRSWKSVRWHRR